MTIYDLLKNSSPSMAEHFKDTDNGIKELETRVTTLEDGSSGKDSGKPFEKIIDSSVQFTEETKTIDHITYSAYHVRFNINTATEKYTYNPLLCPRCPLFMDYVAETSYTEIPMLDYDNYEVFLQHYYYGFAISRNYNSKGLLQHIDLLITKATYESLSRTSTGQPIKYKLYA